MYTNAAALAMSDTTGKTDRATTATVTTNAQMVVESQQTNVAAKNGAKNVETSTAGDVKRKKSHKFKR